MTSVTDRTRMQMKPRKLRGSLELRDNLLFPKVSRHMMMEALFKRSWLPYVARLTCTDYNSPAWHVVIVKSMCLYIVLSVSAMARG